MARKRIDELDPLAITDIATGDLDATYDLSAATAKRQPYHARVNPWLWPPVTYTVDTTLVAGDMFKKIATTGTAADRTFTLPVGVTGYAAFIHNDTDDYDLTIDPNGSEIIGAGGAGKYLKMLKRGAVMLFYTGARWEPTIGYGLEEYEL